MHCVSSFELGDRHGRLLLYFSKGFFALYKLDDYGVERMVDKAAYKMLVLKMFRLISVLIICWHSKMCNMYLNFLSLLLIRKLNEEVHKNVLGDDIWKAYQRVYL